MDWDQTPKKRSSPGKSRTGPSCAPVRRRTPRRSISNFWTANAKRPRSRAAGPRRASPGRSSSSAVSEVLRQIKAAEVFRQRGRPYIAVIGTLLLPLAAHRLIAAFLPLCGGGDGV